MSFAHCLLAYWMVSLKRAWIHTLGTLPSDTNILEDIGKAVEFCLIRLIHHFSAVSGILKNNKIGSFLTHHEGLQMLKAGERGGGGLSHVGHYGSMALARGQRQWAAMCPLQSSPLTGVHSAAVHN